MMELLNFTPSKKMPFMYNVTFLDVNFVESETSMPLRTWASTAMLEKPATVKQDGVSDPETTLMLSGLMVL